MSGARHALGLAAALLVLAPHRSAAQAPAGERQATDCTAPGTAGLSIPGRFDILHSLNTSKEVAQPAFAQYTRPRDGDASGAVAAAVKWQAYATACRSIGPFAEYLWNNLTSKRQNTLRAGLDADWQVRAIGKNFAGHSPLLLGQVAYRSDREKHTESAQAVAQLTWVLPNKTWPAPNATWRVGPLFDLVWAPLLGVVYDEVLRADDDAAEGSIVRLAPQVDLVLYPAAVRLERRLELGFSYLHQADIVDGTSEEDDRHDRRRASASFFPYRNDEIAAGVSAALISGEDPTKGYVDERYWQFGFTLRVK